MSERRNIALAQLIGDGLIDGHAASLQETRTRYLGMSPHGEIAFPLAREFTKPTVLVNGNPKAHLHLIKAAALPTAVPFTAK